MMARSPNDAVHSRWIIANDKVIRNWFFWDETWSNEHGPFNTEKEARQALDDYIYYLETGEVRK